MPEDKFSNNQTKSMADPSTSAFNIMPDDGVDLSVVTTGLNVATPGTVRLTTSDGSDITVTIAPGAVFPIRATRVWLTGTTATGIVGLT